MMNVTQFNTSWPIIYFTDYEYKLFLSLIIVEFLCLVIIYFIILFAIYLIVKVPQFHRHLIGIFCNMGIAEIVINSCRIIQIIASRFEPCLPVDISYVLDPIRFAALFAYFFIVLIMAVERTLATLMLETYEDIKKPQLLFAIIVLPWIFGSGVECLRDLSTELYHLLCLNNSILEIFSVLIIGILLIFVLAVSIMWLLILHFYNAYRYKRRVIRDYNLKERFQLSENIRFLEIVKWITVTMVIGNSIPLFLILLIFAYPQYDYIQIYVIDYALVFNGVAIPIVAITTNRMWKRELIRTIKKLRAKVAPWFHHKNQPNETDRRFKAPDLKTLAGKPMVFSQEEEKNMYFALLQAQLAVK